MSIQYTTALRPLSLGGLVIAAIALSPLALAEGAEHRGLYLGAGAGFGSLENDRDEVADFVEGGVEDFDIDDDDNVTKFFVGYDLNRYLAVEGFYSDLGEVRLKGNDAVNAELESQAYGASLVGKLPLTDWFTLFGKAGLAHWETQTNGNLGNFQQELSDQDGTDPVYGVGAQFQLDPMLLRAEYERYDFDSDYTVDAFTASVGWRF
ncbi:porin family protein [Halomonas sp. KAO]|uniref:porin family protein n=1 Tax=Halomonas sp. KAO TaxID=2783858 RepID=UPI00189FB1B3|nr:porin family protein [Halomonas sp. KAO]MBF7052551.1 porin family protein [Halomonas sp. KAO]